MASKNASSSFPPEEIQWVEIPPPFPDPVVKCAKFAVEKQHLVPNLVFNEVIKAWNATFDPSYAMLYALNIRATPPGGRSQLYNTIVGTEKEQTPVLLMFFAQAQNT